MKEFNSGGSINYKVITCEEDIHLVTDVLRAKLGVFNSEFVLNAVTRCEMDFDQLTAYSLYVILIVDHMEISNIKI